MSLDLSSSFLYWYLVVQQKKFFSSKSTPWGKILFGPKSPFRNSVYLSFFMILYRAILVPRQLWLHIWCKRRTSLPHKLSCCCARPASASRIWDFCNSWAPWTTHCALKDTENWTTLPSTKSDIPSTIDHLRLATVNFDSGNGHISATICTLCSASYCLLGN